MGLQTPIGGCNCCKRGKKTKRRAGDRKVVLKRKLNEKTEEGKPRTEYKTFKQSQLNWGWIVEQFKERGGT